MRKSALLTGLLLGALFTIPLIAIQFLGDQWFGAPFGPYDVFDWLARVLPGDIIVRSIEAMVELIDRFDLGETSQAASQLKKLSALGMFFGGGAVVGTALSVVLRRLNVRLTGYAQVLPGLLAGLAVGMPLVLISRDVNFSATTSPTVSAAWLLGTTLVWGAVLSWSYYRLFPQPAVAPDTAATTASAPATEPAAGPQVYAEQINRREFLVRVGGAAATFTVVGAGVGKLLQERDERQYLKRIRRNRAAAEMMPKDLPNQDDPLEPAPGTRPEYTPLEDHYRIDISLRPPEIDENEYELRIEGLVETPLRLSIDELRENYEPMDQFITLACISNPVGGSLTSTILWTGVSLRDVLADAGLQPSATHIKIMSADRFFETVALDLINEDPRVMLTYDWDGQPLLYRHGFPLRIYIPDLYGMKQPKWIESIEVIDHDEDGYWVERGWDKVARMKATSVVDVAAVDESVVGEEGETLVAIGGIAHAGARGISRVEVRVDDGDWVEAQLREPLSETTWVIWRYDWPFESGRHTFAVRCVEGDGTRQIEDTQGTFPDGASGIHRLTREL
ncbi:MAG: molybdopterin-dependent oxidoreductase [Chloroflexi bacterium]|nr:molybdopterin-dependent oxidoreductase [Chloroflexota bacterium]